MSSCLREKPASWDFWFRKVVSAPAMRPTHFFQPLPYPGSSPRSIRWTSFSGGRQTRATRFERGAGAAVHLLLTLLVHQPQRPHLFRTQAAVVLADDELHLLPQPQVQKVH